MMSEHGARRFLKAFGLLVLAVPLVLVLLLFVSSGAETLAGTVISSGAAAGSGSDRGTVEQAWVELADQRRVMAQNKSGSPLQPGDHVSVLRERRPAGNDVYSVVGRQRQ